MDLKITEEQLILQDMVRGIVEDHCSTQVVRRMEKDPIGIPEDVWQQMTETGLLSLMLPEKYSGVDLTLLDCALIYEQLGRGLVPGPLFESSVMAATMLLKGGTENQKNELLPRIANGDCIIIPAWLEPDNDFAAQGVQLAARNTSDGFVLNGVKRHCFYARAADKLLVLARTGEASNAINLFLVDTDQRGVELVQQQSMAGDTQYKIIFNDVTVSADHRLAGGWETWQAALKDGIVLLAAFAVGGADKALEITLQYSKEREQFDKPIGGFQALAHCMADAQVEVDGARILVWEAAWASSQGKSLDRLAPMAKLFCCNVFRDITAKCEQIHGGYGFTLEYDIQLFFRRAKQIQLNWLGSLTLEDQIAADVLDTADVTVPDPLKIYT